MLEDLSRSHGKALHVWTSVEGLRRIAGARYVPPQDGTRDPVEALSAVRKLGEPSLVVFKDFHPFLSDPIVVRWRELAHHLKNTHTTLILLSPTLSIPVELEKEISVLDVPLPGFEDLKHLLVEIVQVVRKGNRTLVEIGRHEAEQMIQAGSAGARRRATTSPSEHDFGYGTPAPSHRAPDPSTGPIAGVASFIELAASRTGVTTT